MWQETLIQQLRALLLPDAAVKAMVLVGSGASGRFDAWSDVDALLVVAPEAYRRFFPSLAWLAPLGEIYASEQHPGELSAVSRVCLRDMRRFDTIVTTEAALARHAEWPSIPFATGSRVIFSRSAVVDAVLAGPFAPPSSPRLTAGEFDAMASRFWFKATVAVPQVVRGDLLVALHLNLDLIEDCCVLAMMLRDRATGATHHRDGVGNDAVAMLEPTRRPHTPVGILDSIEQSAIAFDRLAARWSDGYQARRQPLQVWIAEARRTVLS
ncbi:MAG: hypothetical protein ACRDJW_25390 [Thermomicrobiales bacterium]